MTTTFTARSPEDLLAAVPVVLGFRPEASLVMLTFGAASPFHARLDLPERADDESLAEIVELLLAPSRRHQVARVAFVFYSDDRVLVARTAAGVVPAFVADGIGVADVLRADRGRWSRVPVRAGAKESRPVPFDDAHHPFSTEAVFHGLVTLGSREELRATVAADPELAGRWSALVAELPAPEPGDVERVCGLLTEWVATGADPDDAGAARVMRAVCGLEVRDAALYAVTRDTAHDHLRVWSALLRGAPSPQVPDTAAVTAFCAWLSGQGALAWCALDRCFEIDPGHVLGSCLASALTRALPPSAWDDMSEQGVVGPGDHDLGPDDHDGIGCFRRPGAHA